MSASRKDLNTKNNELVKVKMRGMCVAYYSIYYVLPPPATQKDQEVGGQKDREGWNAFILIQNVPVTLQQLSMGCEDRLTVQWHQ